ncbi:MAG TPA: hypothetical protein HA303_03815 [Candidatus Thalassarchaeaceae archaeon]|jgi:hypothetical protein|nr:hypothetical protein [Candidatus Thalassarchaeaceae archaeon]DAC34637.1 MAG TPA: hypothetical protein D7H79_03760 [Candidatus Poseidoniales archaeon]HIH80329.1 hypothetical protein [Candidatus Thalassarchaeaceae archaeon]|tara:strand:+ start:476 stop:760 length:285 start_codon:yes stop_codon:yes gene_type:complete
MQSARATVGWIGFALLFGLSLRALIRDESLTMEVWTYLLLMPIALTLAFSTRIFSTLGNHEESEIVDEETEDVDSENRTEAPDPEDAGFDIPVM